MPISRAAFKVLSETARAMGQDAPKGAVRETAKAGLMRLAGSGGQRTPPPSEAAGPSGTQTADANKPAAGESRLIEPKSASKPPMTASGFLKTMMARHRVAHGLVRRSIALEAAYSTRSHAGPSASVQAIREFIDTHKSKELSSSEKQELAGKIAHLGGADFDDRTKADLVPTDVDHLTEKEKIQISDMLGPDVDDVVYHFSDELLPSLGTASRIRPNLGPVGIEGIFNHTQKAVIDRLEANRVTAKLCDWATFSPDKQLSAKENAIKDTINVISSAYDIKQIPQYELSQDIGSHASYDPKTNIIKVRPEILDQKNSVQLIRALAHELTHASQYEQMELLEKPDELAKGIFRDNAVLLKYSTEYERHVISPRMRVSEHPDYTDKLLWHERQAFYMGDRIGELFAKAIGIDVHYENGVFRVSPDAVAGQAGGDGPR